MYLKGVLVCTLCLTSSVASDLRPSPVASTEALGVSWSVAKANTPTVGSAESTTPMASYPTSGPKSLLIEKRKQVK